MTDGEMVQVAALLRRRLHAASPEQYPFIREIVLELFKDFDMWFRTTDPDYLPIGFHNLIFEEYPENLYG